MNETHNGLLQRPKTPILTGVPNLVEDEDNLELVPRRLYFADSMQVTNIKIVFTSNDLIPEYAQRSFRPNMIHQVFGNDGIIYGYRNLNIDIYFLANSAKCFVDLHYTEVTSDDMPHHSQPDDILQKLTPWLPEDYYLDKKKFMVALDKEKHFKQYGQLLHTVQLYNEREKTSYKYYFNICSTEEPGFAKFHSRFQCMIVWYIDGASQIDVEDPNWMFIYVYESRKYGKYCDTTGLYPVGFATIYKFFHFPDKVRARISQFFILPSCQGLGIGTHLLKTTYEIIGGLANVIDITVEDPCPAFTRMRDFLDCQLLMELEPFKKNSINKGYSNVMFTEANKHYKINKRQCRRVYEILRFSYARCDKTNKDYQELYTEITDRLKLPFMKDQRVLEKIKFLSDDCRLDYITDMAKNPSSIERNVSNYIKEIIKTAISVNVKLLKQQLE